ncbi:MAG: hypothetical protein SFY32_13190 [Bacteroidota bacterium]|nr:hypothetical protein [Bacteroidota bacterium]
MKLTSILLLCTTLIFAQNINKTADLKYRRSSIHLMMVDDPSRLMASSIEKSFLASAVPDKYNDHSMPMKKVPYTSISSDPPFLIKQYLENNNIPRDMVAKWFNRNPQTGAFNMTMIQDRGFYNASDLDVKKAKASKRGMNILADAGEELIKNTFIVVCDFSYVNKEDIADAASAGLMLTGAVLGAATGNKDYEKAGVVAAAGAQVAGKGYIVKTKMYLYQLNWNDSVSAVFYNDLWMDETSKDASRKAAFDNSKLFTLKYIGAATAMADLQSSIFTDKTEEQLIEMATANATNSSLVKLEKAYETFRAKTPLYGVKPLIAKIGLKEGLKGQQRFIVYERQMTEDGKTKYKRYGTIRVRGKYIWDNRVNATGEAKPEEITRFYQTTGRKLYPGLLIQQKPDPGFCKPFNILFGQIGRIFH